MPKGRRGRGRPRGATSSTKSRGTQTMKKVSQKGAYKKNVKNQMALRRAPIVETKQRVSSDIARLNGFVPGSNSPTNVAQPLNWRSLVVDDAFTSIPLNSFMRTQRGLEEWEMIGNTLFSKFLNFKLQVRFPEGKNVELFSTQQNDQDPPGTLYECPNKMIEQPTKLYLICGWVTQNFNAPIETLKDAQGNVLPGQRPERENVTVTDLQNYLSNQLRPYFDDQYDKLEFRPRETTNIKIDKYVRIKPDMSSAIGTQAVPIREHISEAVSPPARYEMPAHGSIPQVNKSHSWKTNRKITYTQGENTSFSTDNQHLYPNDSWIPFAVLYNPDYLQQLQNVVAEDPNDPKVAGRFKQVQFMEYRWNDAHYYTDS